MITLAEWVRWTTSSPNIQIGFYYEKQRSGANMQYRIKTVVRRLRDTSSSGSFSYKIIQDISLDGTLVESGHELKGTSPGVWSSNIEYTTGWFTVSNKTTSTTGLAMRIYSTGGSSRNQTWTYDLGVDPAYPNITSFSVSQRDETSVQFNYSVDSTCDWAWYSINDGGWQDLPGNNIVGGLNAGTQYNFKLKVRRQDSQLTSETGNVPQTTHNYPSIASPIPNFKIGDEYAIWLNNPLSRQCVVKILDSNNNEMSSGSSSDYIFGPGFNDATSIDNYYQSIPNSPSGNYKIRLIVSSINRDTTVAGGTYSVKESECIPTFSDFTYADVNATTLALTGSNQSVIPRYSNVTATVSVANKATAKNYATMSSYKFTCGDASDSASYSASSAVNMTINNISSENFTVQAIDSRGIPKLVTKTASTVVSYAELVKDTSSTLKRTTGVSEAVTLNLKGTIWNQSFGSVTNSIKSVTYKYRILNSGDEYETGATTITPTVDENGKFTFNGAILGDTNEGFDIENSYEVVVTVTDELSTITYTFVLAGGKPHIAYHKNGVSIMGAYVPENGGKLQIDGVNIENLLGGGDGTPIGTVVEFAGSTTPDGWLICDGRSLAKTSYPDLFNVIGYTYGGSGSSFNLPNLKGRVPVGYNSSETEFNTLGKTGGSKEMQQHRHYGFKLDGYDTKLNNGSGSGIALNFGWNTGGSVFYTEDAGSGNSGNLQPYITINFVIKAQTTSGSDTLSETLPLGTEVDFDGNVADIPPGWEQCDAILYENSSGTTGNITLSDAIENYKTFGVYFNTEYDYIGMVKYFVYSGATYTLDKIRIDGSAFIVFQEKIQISGTTLTSLTNRSYNTDTGIANDNKVKILKIIGYK